MRCQVKDEVDNVEKHIKKRRKMSFTAEPVRVSRPLIVVRVFRGSGYRRIQCFLQGRSTYNPATGRDIRGSESLQNVYK